MPNQIKEFEESPKIYNLFPRLVGNIKNWLPHIKRASEMGFNWLYINPFHPTGSSGSLYAIKNYFGFNPLFFGSQDHGRPASHLKALIKEVKMIPAETLVFDTLYLGGGTPSVKRRSRFRSSKPRNVPFLNIPAGPNRPLMTALGNTPIRFAEPPSLPIRRRCFSAARCLPDRGPSTRPFR